MNYREALSQDLHSALKGDDSTHVTPLDRVTAFSSSNRLGTLLWRIKYEQDYSNVKAASFLLAKTLQNTNKNLAIKIATQAIVEWIDANCKTCVGSKQMQMGELIIICQTCKGSGVHRYNDIERTLSIGVDAKKFSNLFKRLHDVIGEQDRLVNRTMSKMMGK